MYSPEMIHDVIHLHKEHINGKQKYTGAVRFVEFKGNDGIGMTNSFDQIP